MAVDLLVVVPELVDGVSCSLDVYPENRGLMKVTITDWMLLTDDGCLSIYTDSADVMVYAVHPNSLLYSGSGVGRNSLTYISQGVLKLDLIDDILKLHVHRTVPVDKQWKGLIEFKTQNIDVYE